MLRLSHAPAYRRYLFRKRRGSLGLHQEEKKVQEGVILANMQVDGIMIFIDEFEENTGCCGCLLDLWMLPVLLPMVLIISFYGFVSDIIVKLKARKRNQ